jgi:signal transduction histidine kinase
MQCIVEAIESSDDSLNTSLVRDSCGSAEDAFGSFGDDLLCALQTMLRGDFSIRMADNHSGLTGKIAEALNGLAAANQQVAQQLICVGREVGREGKTRQRVKFGLSSGVWGEMEGAVNRLIDDFLWSAVSALQLIAAIADGDRPRPATLDMDGHPLRGEYLGTATALNAMIRQLDVFTSELNRLVREVQAEGKLGGQMEVQDVTGVWKDLAQDVNAMMSGLAGQIRNIADVTVAVADGDLSKKITVEACGDILQLKDATNTMVDRLRESARCTLEQRTIEFPLNSKSQSEFVAKVSHELRTPLNSILVLSQQLSENPEGNLNRRQVDYVRTIHAAGADLLNIINDILDLSKIESGAFAVEPEEVALSPILEMLARLFRDEAETRRLSFDVHIDSAAARTIVTDAQRLKQVLKNLLSNAFKFTEQGGVRLRVTTACEGRNPDRALLGGTQNVIAFEVSDTGIGIPPNKQTIIFEAFQQADTGTSRKFGGTGLGLAISRELSKLLGGDIQLSSSIPGQGSTFTLYLPVNPLDWPDAARAVGPEQPFAGGAGSDGVINKENLIRDRGDGREQGRPVDDRPVIEECPPLKSQFISERDTAENLIRRKVLVVDDDARNVFALSGVLERRKMKVLTASTGEEAIRIAESTPDLSIILVDIMMPEMDGYETIQRIRRSGRLRRLPIIALTAKAMKGDREKCLDAGASDYLAKPVNTEQLVSTLGTWLSR